MKVFVAGATGALGRSLVPQLVARGHEVVGMTRTEAKQDLVRSLGARPVVADALDVDAVAQAVASAEPEVIVHQLTALSGELSIRDMRHPERAPMAMMTWLPALASALGAKPPRRIPRRLARLVAGEMATVMMTESKGSSNAKAKRELGWEPRHASWRLGFAA